MTVKELIAALQEFDGDMVVRQEEFLEGGDPRHSENVRFVETTELRQVEWIEGKGGRYEFVPVKYVLIETT